MILQLVTTLVHMVTNTPAVHTAPGPIATPVTVISSTASSTIDKGFEVLRLKPW